MKNNTFSLNRGEKLIIIMENEDGTKNKVEVTYYKNGEKKVDHGLKVSSHCIVGFDSTGKVKPIGYVEDGKIFFNNKE